MDQLLSDSDKARDRVVSLEKVVSAQKKEIKQLELAKSEAIEAISMARLEVAIDVTREKE